MSISLTPLTRELRPIVRELAARPSLAAEFDTLADEAGLADAFADPYAREELAWLARVDDEPAGFSLGFLLPKADGGCWSMLRLGVVMPHRRRRVATALLERASAALRPTAGPRLCEEMLAAWVPNLDAAGFAACHGFSHARWFWAMKRGPLPCPRPVWPAGIVTRMFDGSEGMFADWTDIYLRSFAGHYHFVAGTIEDTRRLAALSSFRAEGLVVAYRGSHPVGFCRNGVRGKVGEVELLGVAPEARGIGLGRALLRWGVRWLELEGVGTIELRVDGENETALALYRAEGFTAARTRELWGRVPPG
jgi:mycothiol synthase